MRYAVLLTVVRAGLPLLDHAGLWPGAWMCVPWLSCLQEVVPRGGDQSELVELEREGSGDYGWHNKVRGQRA